MGFEQDHKGSRLLRGASPQYADPGHPGPVRRGSRPYLFAFWYLQVVKVDYYKRLSDNNRLRRVTLMPLRGVISDNEHRVLANNRIAFNIRLDGKRSPT